MRQLRLNPDRRTKLADQILRRLEQATPGSVAELRGSLANGAADRYSDIDVLWEVTDSVFQHCVGDLERILFSMHPVESFRSDPDLQRSAKHRLFFVRFAGLPLFWHLDLEVFARSIGRDKNYDVGAPHARGNEWSLTESALANGLAAIKAHIRNDDDQATQLLRRAHERLGFDTT